MLENLEMIKIETPVDKIIKQIRTLLTSGQINPGDKLPPEGRLAEHLRVWYSCKGVSSRCSKICIQPNFRHEKSFKL